MKTKLVCLLLCNFIIIGIQAQSANTASGGNATGAGGSVSYSVGQIVYTTNTGTGGSVSQGVQQPYEISVITGLKEASGITLQLSVYPNPASDFLKLSLRNSDNPELKDDNLSYQLYDMNGELLQEKKLESNETTIQMGGFTPGTYILKVIRTNNASSRELKTFKIIKSN